MVSMLLLGGCGTIDLDDVAIGTVTQDSGSLTIDPGADVEGSGLQSSSRPGQGSSTGDKAASDEPSPDLSRAATDDCRPEVVGEESGEVVVIYAVFNGQLDGVCFGTPSAVVEDGWDALAEVTPPEQLDAIVLFAGFDSIDSTVAFTGPLTAANTRFLLAIDLESSAEDDDELRLTMAHELAHVFTQTPDQLNVKIFPRDCPTYHNGYGCFREGSFIYDWVTEFWTEEQLATLPRSGAIDEAGGEDRCDVNPGFLGAYSASHPEEDFAESFSAFVFGIDVPSGLEAKMAFFDRRPELAAFADRAAAADREGLPNNFDRCG